MVGDDLVDPLTGQRSPDPGARRRYRHRQDPSRRRHRPRLHPNGHPWPLLQRRRPGQPPRGQTPRRTPGPHRGPAQLKAVLRQIDPDDDNLFHGRPFPHLGVDNTANLAHRDAGGRGTTPSLTVRSFKFPDPRINVPVRVLNFPVMFCREFTGKPLVSSGLPPITGPNSPIFVKIPCIFPDYQGIGAETGSQQTAPTASHPGEAVSSSHSSAKPRETGPVSHSIAILSSLTREPFRRLPGFAACGLRERDARVSLVGTGNFCDYGLKTGRL